MICSYFIIALTAKDSPALGNFVDDDDDDQCKWHQGPCCGSAIDDE